FHLLYLAMLRHLRDLTKQHVREGTVSAAFVVHTDSKGTAFALAPREDLPASFYKAHMGWIAKRSDLDTFGQLNGPIAMAIGQWTEIESSSTDNSKFVLKPTPAADTEFILVVLASVQQFRWTWRILSRLDTLGSPFWRSFLGQSDEEEDLIGGALCSVLQECFPEQLGAITSCVAATIEAGPGCGKSTAAVKVLQLLMQQTRCRHILAAPTKILRDELAKRLGPSCVRVGQDADHNDVLYLETLRLLEEQNPNLIARIQQYEEQLERRPQVCRH
ncbi:unnamed protein product, partial [Cladocopium goreaui]